MPDASGSIDLSNISVDSLSDEEQAALEDLTREREPSEPETRRALTAFLVVVGLDGNPDIMAFNDPSIEMLTSPTPDLIYGAASTMLKDLAAREAALVTADAMQQQAVALQQQMQDQMLQRQVAAGLKNGGR